MRTAAQRITSFDQLIRLVETYPAPAAKDLQLLHEMAEYLPQIPEDEAERIQQDLHRDFQENLTRRLDVDQLIAEATDDIVVDTLDTAIRDIVYMAPGLGQIVDQHLTQLKSIVKSIAKQAGQPTDQALEQIWFHLNDFFDEIELDSDVAISSADRDELLAQLLEEIKETSSYYLEDVQEEAFTQLQAAEDLTEEFVREELDNVADMVSEEIQLDLDPQAHMVGGKLPFYNWQQMVQWFERSVGKQKPMSSGPEFRTKSRSRGPRVVDVTHLQENQQRQPAVRR